MEFITLYLIIGLWSRNKSLELLVIDMYQAPVDSAILNIGFSQRMKRELFYIAVWAFVPSENQLKKIKKIKDTTGRSS